jgi:DNA-binding SARP family transcriptional activator
VRATLETLALRTGSVVQPWELIDTVWGEDPPATARKILQGYIGGLRRSIGSSTIQTIGGGYRLPLEADDVDLNRFERHIRDGSHSLKEGKSNRAIESLTVALGLWRGEPLEELVDSPAGMAARARLSELHRVAQEQLFEARLRSGEHDVLVADLEAAVRVEPFRERRWEQLMLALYRAGRQSGALDAFDRMLTLLNRHRLSPGQQIQALKTAIVARDPALAHPVDYSRWYCYRFGGGGQLIDVHEVPELLPGAPRRSVEPVLRFRLPLGICDRRPVKGPPEGRASARLIWGFESPLRSTPKPIATGADDCVWRRQHGDSDDGQCPER